ncbi:hypothetical protein [Marivirga sp.]|uniref:hypothetical protein n=1 Tax=Marivirga sp. TaxID=2018662 RepID=UPI003DA72643
MEVRRWKLEDGSWKLEVGSWKLEVCRSVNSIDRFGCLKSRHGFGFTFILKNG